MILLNTATTGYFYNAKYEIKILYCKGLCRSKCDNVRFNFVGHPKSSCLRTLRCILVWRGRWDKSLFFLGISIFLYIEHWMKS